MRAKDADGNFRPDFLDIRWGRDYAEGSAWQTSWSVLHDFAGLIKLHGSRENFETNSSSFATNDQISMLKDMILNSRNGVKWLLIEFGQVTISNQPSFHYPYLFSYIGKPWMLRL